MKVFNKEELARLTKLAKYVDEEVKDEQFDMGVYRNKDFRSINDCGTTGCLLGWAPFVEPPLESEFSEFDEYTGLLFGEYCYRVFGAYRHNPGILLQRTSNYQEALTKFKSQSYSISKGLLLGYIFNVDWKDIPTTATRKAGIERINKVVKHNTFTEEMYLSLIHI